MDDFAETLARIYSRVGDTAKGTVKNMMRVPSGQADREMLEQRRRSNAELINNAQPGGVPAYRGMQEEMDPQRRRKLFGNPYSNALRALFNNQ